MVLNSFVDDSSVFLYDTLKTSLEVLILKVDRNYKSSPTYNNNNYHYGNFIIYIDIQQKKKIWL